MTDRMSHTPSTYFERKLHLQFSNEVRISTSFILLFVLDGSAALYIFENKYEMPLHGMGLIHPNEIFCLSECSQNLRIAAFYIHEPFWQQFCPQLGEINFKKHVITEQYDRDLHNRVCSQISDIVYASLRHDVNVFLDTCSAYAAMLSTVIEGCGSRLNDTAKDDYVSERILKILNYMNTHYQDKLTLGDLAEHLNIHPQYLSTFFKKYLHMNFVDFLNMIRLNKALSLLHDPKVSITDISFACGFASYKTFVAAFKKVYASTPTQYRDQLQYLTDITATPKDRQDYYAFFTKYHRTQMQQLSGVSGQGRHMNLFFDTTQLSGNLPPNNRRQIFSVGRASNLLRRDLQQQVIEASRELKIEGLRIRDIFSDDLFVYNEDDEKNPVYNWQTLDQIFDFLLSLGIHPYPVISFMPKRLAAKKQYAGWNYQPNVSFPKSLKRWARLIEAFANHYIERYGIAEVRTWYFDFWTAPNIHVQNGYWQEDMDSFFLLYRATYIALKNTDEQLLVGTPDFSMPTGMNWYRSFFDYCKTYEITPSYLCVHLYNSEDNYDLGNDAFAASISRDMILLKYEKDSILYTLRAMRNMLESYHLQLPIIISDWSNTYFSRDLTRDTCFTAAYVCYLTVQFLDYAKMVSYHSLSDINEDFYPADRLFMGGSGIMDMNGIKRSVYHAFYLMDMLGDEIVEKGSNYIFTRSKKGYQILIFNFVTYDSLYSINDNRAISYSQRYSIYEHAESLIVHLLLHMVSGTYSVERWDVNRDNGSAYDLWVNIGAPQKNDPAFISYLKQKSLPKLNLSTVTVEDSLVFDMMIPAHGVTLMKFEPTENP